eukprot:GDKI01014191.1.p1 GENE.GDKI01014191.1~~GDKI01014191.1.p1  ORF type:complete len:264 (+),score=82.57 GDKI01014191.1:98-793(+)
MEPYKHTTQPIMTGSSVVAVKYKDGIMMAADTQLSYGRMSYTKQSRIAQIGENTLIGCGGEFSDFQYIKQMLDEVETEDWANEDGIRLSPAEYASYLGRVMYNRRSKMDPLWNQIVVGGFQNGKSYLGYVDMHGTIYEEKYIATGYAMYFAKPLLESRSRPDMTEDEARVLLEDVMRVLFYRDCLASAQVQVAAATALGTRVSEQYQISHNWSFKHWLQPTMSAGLAGSSW